MSSPSLPAVPDPVANGEEGTSPEGLVLDLSASNKFSVSWPSDTRRTSTPPASARMNLSFAEGDSDESDGDSGNERRDSGVLRDEEEKARTSPVQNRIPTPLRSPAHPRLSRALSMPLQHQLGYLKHPHRSDTSSPSDESLSYPVTPNLSRIKDVSMELADSVQMMIQTMLQISPPQLLDSAKEQFSACSLSVPTSSMSAMLTSMKNLNYISANMAGLCSEIPRSPEDIGDVDVTPLGTPPIMTDFDIGETLQNVGDSLSGFAAQVDVDLVIYHGDDIGLRHVCVKGDESGISYAISHVIRKVLLTTKPGDSIELGLLVGPLDPKTDFQSPSPDETIPSGSEGPLSCTIRISHKYGSSFASPTCECTQSAPVRPQPSFSTVLLRQLLRQIGATLTPNLPPPKFIPEGRTCDFTLSLDRGSLSVLNTPIVHISVDDPISEEPTVEQLMLFAEDLKGKRVTLYANAKGSFAQHLTSYLTAWGMDVTHVSPDGEVDGLPDVPSSPTTLMPPPSGLPPSYKPDSPTDGPQFKAQPSFIFIDDDVDVLKERLYALRDKPYPLNLNLRKRPSLASHHRPRSSPQVARVMGIPPISSPSSSIILVHFTSISNYKVIKDVIQSVTASHAGSNVPLPEVLIIPKPAGPRRFLTALHTAITRPVVDPFFSPIATSPSSPSVHANGSFFHSYHHNPEQPPSSRASPKPSNRPSGSRSNSDRSTKSTKDLAEINTSIHPPPSPLGISDNMEYFSEAAVKLGASPSSGLVIQSPDGQPAGIFFHPRVKSPRNPSAHSMERDKGQLHVSEQKRRSSRLSINDPTSTMSFSALHSMATTTSKSAVEAWNATSPSARALARKSSSEASTPTASSSGLPRKAMHVETAGKPTPSGSPPPDNVSPVRRTAPRRVVKEPEESSSTMAAANKKTKATTEGNIVPPISVLIVDDNPINQTILSTFMKKRKIKFDLANNGQEAVQKFRTGDFHLILMDIQMPVMDGIQATKEIRRLEQVNAAAGYPPGTPSFDETRSPMETPSDSSSEPKSVSSPYRSSVIIVALTASSLQSDRVAALAAGCNDFLTKPVSLIWLNSKIIEWGSLKALQMWADRGSSEAKTMSSEQAAQARNVADRLHVPQGRSTPSPSRKVSASHNRRTPPPITVSSGPLPASTSVNIGNGLPIVSPVSPTFWNQSDRSSSGSYWSQLGVPLAGSPTSTKAPEEAKDLVPGRARRLDRDSELCPVGQTLLVGAAATIRTFEVTAPTSKHEMALCDEGKGKQYKIPSRSNSYEEPMS